MALLNPSFEDAGALPGDAAHWTLTAVTSIEELAGFGVAPEDAWEDFERWFALLSSIDDIALVLAFFDSALRGYEAFDAGWANAVYLYELPPAQLVTATFEGVPAEECETGWSNVPYAHEWTDVVSATGVFDGEPREDFEDLWRSNQLYAWTWATVISSTAMFDAGAQAVEDFESAWTSMTTLGGATDG